MMNDEDLWELTLEQLHLEYVATQDAGGGDRTQEFHERVVELLMNGIPAPVHESRTGTCDRHRTEVRDHGDGHWYHTDDKTECDSTIKLGVQTT